MVVAVVNMSSLNSNMDNGSIYAHLFNVKCCLSIWSVVGGIGGCDDHRFTSDDDVSNLLLQAKLSIRPKLLTLGLHFSEVPYSHSSTDIERWNNAIYQQQQQEYWTHPRLVSH